MTATDVVAALDLPTAARVDRRVPKTLLLQHGAPTTADKRRLSDGIEQLTWVAALKPNTAGVAAYRDDEREYLEIAVLQLTLRPTAKLSRLTELVHRAVPYPLLVVTALGDRIHVSVAHKRWSLGEAGKTVLDGMMVAVDSSMLGDGAREVAFLAALAFGRQPRGSLLTVYQGWMDTLLALLAARRTGAFTTTLSADRLAARRDALRECEILEAAMAQLRAAAAAEQQTARLVTLNLELKRLQAEWTLALANL